MIKPQDEHIIEGTLGGIPFSLSCRSALEISVGHVQRLQLQNERLTSAIKNLPQSGDLWAGDEAVIALRKLRDEIYKGKL